MPKPSKRSTSPSAPKSMTGFGVASGESRSIAIDVELKSANSRFLDLIFRLPRVFNQFEADIRGELAGLLERGRVEIAVVRTAREAPPVTVNFNRTAFNALAEIYARAGKEIGASKEEIRSAVLSDVLGRHEVLEVQESPPEVERERSLLLQTVRKAAQALNQMRVREGESLVRDIRSRLRHLEKAKDAIAEAVARKPEAARDRLMAAVKRLTGEVQIDPARLHSEIAMLADRTDVTEELVRVASHLAQFETVLKTPPVGKKLDFLIQELVREFNTIGSKAQDAAVQGRVVDAKAEIEKIREQVQNLE